MEPAILNFDAQVRGNTFDELTVQIKENGVAVDLTGCNVRMQIKDEANNNISLKILTEVDGIDILPAGNLSIKKFRIDFKSGKHVYDLVVKFPTGDVVTYFEGKFPVKQNVSDI